MSQYDASHPDPGGRFLQLSGLTVTFDVRRTIGQRVVEARVAVTGEKVIIMYIYKALSHRHLFLRAHNTSSVTSLI